MLRLHNTLSGKIEEFVPIKKGATSMYNCGPTVYDYAHIGNLRTFVSGDLLRRTLEYAGLRVKQVMNLTDIGHLQGDSDEGDDKMVSALRRLGKPETLEGLAEVGTLFADAFREDLQKLNIETPESMPRASEHIKEQVALIKTLVEKGFAYKIEDGVYFDISKFTEYGKLGGQSSGDEAGARVTVNTQKRNPRDFTLWKMSERIGWDSPWGKGFPGWHIECSAMSVAYLGQPFDIHTGGIDLIPTHHNNEIAQSEAAAGKELAKYWFHSAFLTVEDSKMAKSAGTFVTLRDIEAKGFHPLALRYLFLTAHYRSPLNFTWEALSGAQTALSKLYRFLADEKANPKKASKKYIERFSKTIYEDLGTPQTLALIWELIRDESLTAQEKRATLLAIDAVLGLRFAHAATLLVSLRGDVVSFAELPPAIQSLVRARETARSSGNYAEADRIRGELTREGYLLRDTTEGPEITKK